MEKDMEEDMEKDSKYKSIKLYTKRNKNAWKKLQILKY